MFRHLCFILLFFILAETAKASDAENTKEIDAKGDVVLETATDYSKNYLQRRTQNGFLFSINSESFYPLDYQSQFADGYIEDIIGSDAMRLIGVEFGYKRNLNIGSISALVSYSTGSAEGITANRNIAITKQEISANVAVDGVLDEPWIVPYAQAGVHQISVNEEKNGESRSASTGFSFGYKYGLLFQLDALENAIDKGAKAERLISSGLENTFIDLYYATYLASSNAQDPAALGSEGDPNTASSDEMGIGLKLEF